MVDRWFIARLWKILPWGWKKKEGLNSSLSVNQGAELPLECEPGETKTWIFLPFSTTILRQSAKYSKAEIQLVIIPEVKIFNLKLRNRKCKIASTQVAPGRTLHQKFCQNETELILFQLQMLDDKNSKLRG